MNNSPAPFLDTIADTKNRPRVIVLMFDGLSFPPVNFSEPSPAMTNPDDPSQSVADAGQGASDDASGFFHVDAAWPASVWDQLDLESAFFEQHYAQSPVSALTGSDRPQQEHQSADWQYVACSPGSLRQLLNPQSEQAAHQAAGLPSAQQSLTTDAGCLWIEIRSGTSQACPDEDVEAVLDWLDQTDSGRKCTLIVTARQSHGRQPTGNSDQSAKESAAVDSPPTAASAAAGEDLKLSQCHVPLWIRLPDRQMRRIQSLSGSFDLIPTINEILDRSAQDFAHHNLQNPPEQGGVTQLVGASVEHATHGLIHFPQIGSTSAASDASAGLAFAALTTGDQPAEDLQTGNQSDRPQSLIPLCFHPGQPCVRVLKIRTQTCDLLRNGGFLAVKNLEQAVDDGLATPAGFNEPRLYVKPEDVWQVNTQARVYESVLEEFDKLW